MKRILTIVLMLALALAVSSAWAAESILVYGTTEKVTDMDPANAYDFHTWEIFQNIYQGLVAYAPGTTDLVPALALSWTANAAGDEFTFKLRKGVKFTDGTPLTAEVVKWTIDRNAALKGDPSWLITDFVKSVEAVDESTVKFILTGPIAYFPKLLPNPPYFPLNPKVYPVDKIVKDVAELTGGEMVGLGPYSATSFKRDEEVVLDANPSFWGKEPAIKKIIIRYFADATTMRLALERGEIDLAYKTMNPSDINDLSKSTKLTTYKLPGPYIRYLCFETSESIFKDKKLRQAVAALINRPEIVRKVFLGQNSPLYSMVPKGMIYHTEDYKTIWGDGNVAAAERILKGLGYSAAKPFSFDLWYTPTHYGDTEVNVAEVMKVQLEKTPLVKVTIKSAEWATYKEQWKNKQMAAFLLGWYPDYVDPDNYTAAFAGTSGSKGMGIFFSSKVWDDMFTKEQTNTAEAVRKDVFSKIQRMWTDENPTVPIFQGDLYVFTKKNVTGVKIGPPLIFNYDQLQFVK
ncbi:MAG: ABC transporter substrate-binding protein [Spirochaetes bacterium]|nr:ABC transporter substrate-binding protein [Spirochaetota bacterium]